jgi:hypothetical protein
MDARYLVDGFKSTVAHLASEIIHDQEPAQRERFYEVIDTMIRLILAGLEA